MFCIVTFSEQSNSEDKKGLLPKFKKRKPEIKDYSIGTVHIRILNYKTSPENIKIKHFKKLTGHGLPVLYDGCYDLSNFKDINLFNDKSLMERLCAKSLIDMLKRGLIKSEPLSIALYDPNGEYSYYLPQITAYASDVSVISDKTDLYNELANAIFYDTGAVILVSENRKLINPCKLILAPKRIEEKLELNNNAFVFTSRLPTYPVSCNIVSEFIIKVEPHYMELCPSEIDIKKFTCALYSLENLKYLGDEIPFLIHTGTGDYSPEKIASMIK